MSGGRGAPGRRQAFDAAGDDGARHRQVVERAAQALRRERAAGAERMRMLRLQAIECGVGGVQAMPQAEQ